MTTEAKPAQEQKIETTETKGISDPNLSFADYERLRSGETLPESEAAHSAPEAKATEQKKHSESETEESEEKESAKTETEESESEKETESEESEKDEKPKKKGGFQRRIDKLNAQKSAAQQELEYWKQMALKGAGESKKETPVESKPAAAAEGKPKPESFETHAEYVEALTDWKVEQKQKELSQKLEKTKLETEQQNTLKKHSERVKSFAEKTEDFQDVLESVDHIRVSPAVQQLIVTSENGPELMYELAKNPKEFERINQLPPLAAAREFGRIESKLTKPSEEKSVPKKTTQAPKPIDPVGSGKTSTVTKTPEDMSFAEYERFRREQMKRRRG